MLVLLLIYWKLFRSKVRMFARAYGNLPCGPDPLLTYEPLLHMAHSHHIELAPCCHSNSSNVLAGKSTLTWWCFCLNLFLLSSHMTHLNQFFIFVNATIAKNLFYPWVFPVIITTWEVCISQHHYLKIFLDHNSFCLFHIQFFIYYLAYRRQI